MCFEFQLRHVLDVSSGRRSSWALLAGSGCWAPSVCLQWSFRVAQRWTGWSLGSRSHINARLRSRWVSWGNETVPKFTYFVTNILPTFHPYLSADFCQQMSAIPIIFPWNLAWTLFTLIPSPNIAILPLNYWQYFTITILPFFCFPQGPKNPLA